MSWATRVDLWMLDKLTAWWTRRQRKGRHRTDGISTMQFIRTVQAAR